MARRKKRLGLHTQLASIPVRNVHVEVSEDIENPGALLVQVDLKYRGWKRLARRILKARRTRSFRLDGVGREIYESVDGERSFEGLIDAFAARHHLTFFEARGLLMQYMQTLMKRGLVVIGVPRDS